MLHLNFFDLNTGAFTHHGEIDRKKEKTKCSQHNVPTMTSSKVAPKIKYKKKHIWAACAQIQAPVKVTNKGDSAIADF